VFDAQSNRIGEGVRQPEGSIDFRDPQGNRIGRSGSRLAPIASRCLCHLYHLLAARCHLVDTMRGPTASGRAGPTPRAAISTKTVDSAVAVAATRLVPCGCSAVNGSRPLLATEQPCQEGVVSALLERWPIATCILTSLLVISAICFLPAGLHGAQRQTLPLEFERLLALRQGVCYSSFRAFARPWKLGVQRLMSSDRSGTWTLMTPTLVEGSAFLFEEGPSVVDRWIR